MQQHHIATRRPNRWPCNLSLSLILLLVLVVSGSDAIVKQQQQQQQQPSQQQQQQPQQAQQVQPQQQQRSDDSQQAQAATNGQQVAQQHQSSSSAYNNHKSPSSQSSSAVPNSSYSSSVSISSAAGLPSNIGGSVQQQAGPNVLPQSQVNAANQQQQQQQSAAANYASYGPQSAANPASLGPKSYLDSMSAAASNPDQSYQAAASSVNMALANSGIFGSNSAAFNSPSSQSGAQQQQQQSAVSPQSLNPLHYFYYPAKENQGPATGAGIQAKAGQQQQLSDMLSNSASNNYQSLAYPSYSDQLNSALSSMGSGPEPAGSSQDPSYLTQPGSGLGDNMSQGSLYNNGPQQQSNQQPQQQSQQAQQNGPHQGYNGDLSGYNSNLQPQSAPAPQNAGVSFNGPSSNGQDYLNSHQQQQQPQQQQPQQVSPLSAYQNNLYNQMGDLSTSNFGNNAGGLASVASYMSPGQQDHTGQSGHDLFNAASLLGPSGQQFNSAASQLSPSAVSPPGNQQQQQQQQQQANQNANPLSSSSLFNAASSLFGGNSQQASNAAAAAANNLFSNQQYLNSFLSPQQYSQLTGQQQPSQLNDQISASASSPATAVASGSSSSGKRFGISSFIMPLLAVAGLSLLIPTMSNIGTAVGRRKRSIEDRASSSSRQQQIAFEPLNGASQLAKEMSIGEYMDKIERYYSIYKNAVENDDCLNRLICEFGSAVKDVTGKSAVVTVVEKLVPTWMTGKMHLFKEAALDHKEGREKCKKYVCHSNKQH